MDPASEAAAAQRRAARAHWPIVRRALRDESADDLSAITTPTERIAMMWRLAESAWKLAGRTLPAYERRSIPARLFRPGEPRPDDDDA
jgi:hypothetical protein